MSKESPEKEPAVIVAEKKEVGEQTDIIVLSTGVQARLVPVSASLIDEVTAQVKNPLPPLWMNDAKGREEPNPSDPAYLQELEAAERERGVKAMDALVMFGVELVDGVPEDDVWLQKLQFLGVVEPERELSPMEREFIYKKHVALSAVDIGEVTKMSGISAEEVEVAEATFQRS